MTDSPTTAPEESTEPPPEEERAQRAADQNLPEGAVPEQRPQASQQTDPSDKVSELSKRLAEAGEAPEANNEPMPQEAYDKASSDSQMKKAAKESKSEGIMVGNMVESTKGPHEGRIFAVTRLVSFKTAADLVEKLAGSPEQLYSVATEVEATAIGDERDGERLILNVEDAGLEKKNESFRGSRAGRRH